MAQYKSRHKGTKIDDAVDNVYNFPGTLILPGFDLQFMEEEIEHEYTEKEATKYIPLILESIDFKTSTFKRQISISCWYPVAYGIRVPLKFDCVQAIDYTSLMPGIYMLMFWAPLNLESQETGITIMIDTINNVLGGGFTP